MLIITTSQHINWNLIIFNLIQNNKSSHTILLETQIPPFCNQMDLINMILMRKCFKTSSLAIQDLNHIPTLTNMPQVDFLFQMSQD